MKEHEILELEGVFQRGKVLTWEYEDFLNKMPDMVEKYLFMKQALRAISSYDCNYNCEKANLARETIEYVEGLTK